ncbi:sensor histidine kinase [Anaerocolumna sp. AGMB13025]|uniref:sensor histidine kinase n=1 Tax=Anaerocolumna sp. AGMB13025 TaxID=3039116 RepID=UPI00241E9E34|nr:sensor histidine kinase [Anaerocolumna sp. AGMB13025]WFR55041.1 sensor histidine kinase [Anaerocolumna sp. AGMB13025]
MCRRSFGEPDISLNRKLRLITMNMLLPLLFWVVLVVLVFGLYELKYSKITHNVNLSSKFNMDFKETIDLKMYYYSVESKQQTTLPVADVDDAIALASSLIKSTYRKESKRTLKNILDYCENLKNKMYMIEQTRDYDSRMVQLDNNIYVLTKLIQGKMINYIYYEAGYMADLEQKMKNDIRIVVTLALLFVFGTVIYLLYYGLRFSKSVTVPISKLCNNVNAVGNGEFAITLTRTKYKEIAQLDTGIEQMAERIKLLLDSVKEEEKMQHKMQLKLLQAQINPHFLYNTLDTIVWLVEAGKHGEAVVMLGNLSVFFRTILSKGQDVIPLREEVKHTKSYLDIQQVRYQDILEFTLDIPEKFSEVKLPKLTLQPLAENALYHGVKEKRGKSTIAITCREIGEDDILLSVADNGIGIRPEKLESLKHALENSEKVGFGLSAVHERIKLYFGEEYGIDIMSEYGSGTTVNIRIPKNFEPKS